jgi:hypothetical protein
LITTGNPLPDPIVLTIAQYLADPEAYEGSLIGFPLLTMVGGIWPSPGNHATVQISDGIDTLDMRINRHTDVDDNPEPSWPMDIIAVGQQYTSNIPPNDGYQIMPRFYSDFQPPGTLTQNSLTHNTGTLEVTIIDNGYIGDDGTGSYGGVVFNGNQNAMYTAGLIFGQNGEGYGNYYSQFVDFYNYIPITGFFSIPHFNQYAHHTVSLLGNPDSRTMVESLSDNSHDFVFLRANISNDIAIINDLYPGIFTDWDIGDFTLNRGGYDPSRNLFYMYENGGATDASYYGIMGIAINGMPLAPNTMHGIITTDVAWDRFAFYNFMTSTVFDTITTDGDYRMWTCVGPLSVSPGSKIVVDIAIVAGTSLADLIANADDAILYGQYVPVELTSFGANVNNNGDVLLNWTTTSELNNQMFEIERRSGEGQYIKIGYVNGHGTTSETQEYTYVDNTVETGSYFYRLKQIDFLGQYEYSDEIEAEVNGPLTFSLEQNYPNPFNPSTNIKYSVAKNGDVKLAVYNLIGEEVNVLVSGQVDAGFYEIKFDATALPSGIYFYRLNAGNYIETKKMLLIK